MKNDNLNSNTTHRGARTTLNVDLAERLTIIGEEVAVTMPSSMTAEEAKTWAKHSACSKIFKPGERITRTDIFALKSETNTVDFVVPVDVEIFNLEFNGIIEFSTKCTFFDFKKHKIGVFPINYDDSTIAVRIQAELNLDRFLF